MLNQCHETNRNIEYLLREKLESVGRDTTIIRLSPAGIDGRIKTPFLLTFKPFAGIIFVFFNYFLKTDFCWFAGNILNVSITNAERL